MSDLLNVKGLTIRADKRLLLDNISLTLRKGEPLVILGQTGSGKSLLLKWIMACIDPRLETTGECQVYGNTLVSTKRRQLWGTDMTMLAQEPMMTLDPLMKSGEQVAEVSRFVLGMKAKLARKKARQDLADYGLERAYDKRVGELSGGMAQRLAICVSTAANAPIVLADEPTKGLDVSRRDDVVDLLKNQTQAGGLVVVTHDVEVAERLGGKVLVLHYGQMVEQGDVDQVLNHPQQAYTQKLVAATPKHWPENVAQAAQAQTILDVDNVAIERGSQRLFEQLSFSLKAGEIVGIVGDSGCGKSSLGDAILGNLTLKNGSISRVLSQEKAKWLKLYQDPFSSLAKHLTLGKMLDDLVNLHHLDRSRIKPLMARLSLREAVLNGTSSEVSGGELQRFSILRALLMNPTFLFADEPTSRLDPIIAKEVTLQLAQLAREQHCGLLIVSHDPDLIRKISDRVINISDYAPKSQSLSVGLA